MEWLISLILLTSFGVGRECFTISHVNVMTINTIEKIRHFDIRHLALGCFLAILLLGRLVLSHEAMWYWPLLAVRPRG